MKKHLVDQGVEIREQISPGAKAVLESKEEMEKRYWNSEKSMSIREIARELGCGYDFEIKTDSEKYQVEIKGLDSDSGGISFTSKEWNIARKLHDTYFIGLIRNVCTDPHIQFIRNPAAILKPIKRIYTSVQVQWNVPESNLKSYKE